MDENLQKQVQQRIKELPADVQNAILNSDLSARVQKIGERHSLHVDQIGSLEDETLLVMLAFADPVEFVGNLAQGLKIPEEKAAALGDEVAKEIFMPIRESMREFAEAREAETSADMILKDQKPAAAEKTPLPKTPSVPAPKAAEEALTSLSVQTAAPPKPPIYKKDPYREPTE